jgi:hypothetical protein
LELANVKPHHILYDLGCGDASFLIFAVEKYGIRKAVGYENIPQRVGLARKNIRQQGLSKNITIISKDFNKGDLSEADVILDMLAQGRDDYEKLYSAGIKEGAKIIKHDLPLIGFMPDKVDYPFYKHSVPLLEARNAANWASIVLGFEGTTLHDVWHELRFCGYEKACSKWEIRDFMKIAAERFHAS